MSAIPRHSFAGAPAPMREAAQAFQTRFGVDFATLTHLSCDQLAALHARGGDEPELMRNVFVASDAAPDILGAFERLTSIANLEQPSMDDRAEYFRTLQSVYRRLAHAMPPQSERLLVAPEREGRILAEALGWLRPGLDLTPHAKRIPYEHGLLVGVSHCAPVRNVQCLAIVDGAIASGATIIALLELLASPGMEVEIFSVHAAREGLRAIFRCADAAGWRVRIHAGHVTEGLSGKFYAVAPRGLAVGDLGDMIDSVAVPARAS